MSLVTRILSSYHRLVSCWSFLFCKFPVHLSICNLFLPDFMSFLSILDPPTHIINAFSHSGSLPLNASMVSFSDRNSSLSKIHHCLKLGSLCFYGSIYDVCLLCVGLTFSAMHLPCHQRRGLPTAQNDSAQFWNQTIKNPETWSHFPLLNPRLKQG